MFGIGKGKEGFVLIDIDFKLKRYLLFGGSADADGVSSEAP
jgi:hypothetical protein